MKKVICFVVCCMVAFLLTACSNKITVKGEDGTEYESYQECCAAQDFQAAHQYLVKLKNSEEYSWYELSEAKNYVFKQEALYLMSLGDDSAKKRLLYLLKEECDGDDDSSYHNQEERKILNNHISMLIDLAIENDDEAFVKTLANQYRGDVNDEMLKKMVLFLAGKESENNKVFFTSLFKKLRKEKYLLEYAIKRKDRNDILNYMTFLSFEDNEMVEELVAFNDKSYSDNILSLISRYGKSTPPRPPFGKKKTEYLTWKPKKEKYNVEYNKINELYSKYRSYIEKYNGYCWTILTASIKGKNQYLAQRILDKFKASVKDDGEEDTATYIWDISNDNTMIEDAKSTYKEAVRNGAFK